MAKKTENAPGAGKSGVPSIKEENRLPIQQILYKKTGNAVNMKQSEDMFSPNPLKTPDVIANMWRVRGEAKRDGMAILDQIRKEREQSGLTAARKQRDAAAKALDAHKNNRDKYRTADALANGSDGQAEYDAEKARLEKILHQAAADYDTAEIGMMNDDERADLDTIAKEKGKGFWKYMSTWTDADALNALAKPEETEVFQQAQARKRLNEKYDDSRINQLAETRSRELNRQEADDFIQQTREQTDEHPILSNTGAVLANISAGIAGTGDAAYSAIKQKLDPNGKYYAPDVNLPGYRASQYVDAVRGRTSENILGEEPDFWAKAANTVYGLGTNAVDVGIRAAMSGGAGFVGAGLAATDTFQRSYRDAIQRDGNADKAAVYAMTKAGIEYATNKISLDKLFSTKDPETIKQLLKNAFGQGVEEATQNEVEFLTGLLTDAVIMGQNSEYNQTLGDMIAAEPNKDPKEIKKDLLNNYVMQALETAASSGFAGFTMSVGNQLPGYARNRIAGNLAKAQPAQTPEQAPQGDTLEQEAAAARAAQAAEQIGQDLKAQQDAQEAQQPAKPQLTDEEVQARVEAAMARTAEDAKQKRLQQQVYEDLKAAQKEQKDLLRDIEKAEKKLKQTGKGSPARIEQMKAQLEQVNDLVRQIESQKNLFDGNYERTVAQAVSEQEQIFQQAKQRAADALNAYERGEITENQRDAEVNAYNNAGAELLRLKNMSQEEYRAELAEVGLIGDRANPELETGRVQPAEPQQDAAEMQQNPENAAQVQRPQSEPEVRRQPVQEAQAQRPQAETPTKSYDEQRKNYTNAVNRMNDAMAAYEKGEISKKQLDAVIRACKKESKELERIRSQPETAPNTEQKNVYMDSVKRLKDALDAYDRGEITNEQRDAALDAYTKESAELDRMRQGNVQESRPEPEMQSPPQAEPAVQMPKAEGQPLAQDVEGQTRRAQPGSYEAGMEDVETKPPRPKRHKKAEPIPEMEEGNSVGPAEAGFTGKNAYNEVIGDSNVQRDRRDDARPMDIPAKDINGRKVSETAGNVYGSRFTPDEFADLMQEPAARGDLSYVPISNDKSVSMATKSIERSGSWERAHTQWSKEVSQGKAGAELTARGCLLLNKAARDGDREAYMDILVDLRQLGTNTAQGLQAFRIVRNFTPEDNLDFATAVVKRFSAKVGKDITIDQTLITAYKMAGSDAERAKIMGDIQQNIADQTPATLMEKFNAVRYINMLGNLKTNARNVAGNVGNAAAYRMKDSVGAIIEGIANKVTGGRVGRTKSMYVNPEQYKAAGKFFDDNADAIASGGKFNVTGSSENDFMQGVMDRRRIFKSDTLEGVRKGTDWMLNNRYFGDEAFGRLAFSRSLAGFLKANGVTETDFSKVDKKLLDQGIAYAVKQAQEATFHDNNTVTRALGKMKRSTGIVGEGVTPFVKTPANVLIRAEEFSPLGLINSTYASLKKAAGGTDLAGKDNALGKWAASGADISGTDIIDSWAKSITGTGIAFLGGVLGNAGLLIGGADEDEKKAEFDKMNGVQPYALRIGNGKTLTIDFLSPVCMPLFMGKEIFRLLSDADQNFTMQDWEKVMTSIADPMIRMSMLQGLNDTLSDIRYADNNLFQFLLNACVSYLTQGLSNTFLGQLERSFEKNRMTTYIDKDSNTPVWLQKRLGSLSQRIPGWDYQQREYRDAFGNTQESGGLLYNTLSPGYISQERDDAVTRELNTLRELTGEDVYPKMPEKTITYTDRNGNVVKDHNLSMEELDTIQRVQGKTAEKIVSQLVQDSTYKSLPPQKRAKAMQLAKEYASEKGRQAALPAYYNKETEWMTRATQNPSKVIAEKVAADALSDAVSETMNRYAKGWDTKVADKELEDAYQTIGKLKGPAYDNALDGMSQAGRDYVEARKANISPKVYMDTMRDLADLKPEEEGKTNPNQKQKLDTVAQSHGMTENQRAIVAKQVLSEAKSRDLDEAMERGYSVEDFSKLYRLHDDYTHGYGKKNRTIAKIIEEFDLVRKLGSKKAAYAEASALYDIFK